MSFMSNIITLKRGICIFPVIWQELRSVFPGKMISVYNHLRNLYALPFLPSEHIHDAFTKLED